MADTAVAVTAGAGTNIDTRTEATNGNHRQVVVLGDPSVNAGVAPVDATNGLSVSVTNASLTVASHAVTNAGTFAVQNTAALPAGTNAIGKLASNSGVNIGTVTVDATQLSTLLTSGAVMSAGYQLVALPTDQAVPNKVQAQSSGTTVSRVNAAASTNATSLKASAGNLYEIDVFNVAAYDVFLKFYNKASAPTVGTDTPVWTIPVKAGTGFSKSFHFGRNFATGVAYAITKLQADSDTTVVVAGDLTGSIGWI